MKKIIEKNELTFALIMIAIYTIGQSLATSLNKSIGIDYSANAILNIVLTIFLLVVIFKSGRVKYYGLCKASYPAKKFLYYIPLLIVVSQNLWNGFAINFELSAMLCYLVYMLCVGIVEELLFRGLLFRAIAKDNVKQGIIISSVTFGIGHLINLLNGVSGDIVETACQVVGAVALGFLFVLIVYRGGSILPCILTHSGIDIASAFANMVGLTAELRIVWCLIRIAVIVAYALWLSKKLGQPSEAGAAK